MPERIGRDRPFGIETKAENGFTALKWAVDEGHDAIADLLRKHGGKMERNQTS